ncbi:Fe-S cluster assembly protein SufD [Prosthecomicrobium sp. N25]|uniref:Fe-S cluster assembly protein SufD n=1 Tax=Prosthecomicrobium sp. N25 TaxID=3129254 RepID=UPI003076A477
MTVQPAILRTQAEKDLIEAYRQKPERADSSAILQLRDAAFARFEKAGLPHRRVEEYKYTDLRALLRGVPPLARPADPETARAVAAAPASLAGVDRHRLVFVNGHFEPLLSDVAGLDGVSTHPLSTLLPHGHTLGERLGISAAASADPIVTLNTGLMRDGMVIRVSAKAKPKKPIEIAHVSTGAAASVALRHVIEVEPNAEVTFLETFRGPEGVPMHTNAVTELRLEDCAKATWIKLQTEAVTAVHFSTLVVTLGEKAALEHFALGAGAAVARSQLFLTFAGEHATLSTRGATLLDGRRHGDTTLVIDHAVPHGTSRELYKAVVDDEARSIFQGKIVVRQHAQKTDGKMSSNAILLSDSAEAMNKPELEIFADDVVCGHGATTGEIDDRLKFYLMSRGIPESEAEKLLIVAFLGEVFDAIENEAVRDAVAAEVEHWLERRATRAG